MKALFISGVSDNGKADVMTTAEGNLSVVMSGSCNLAGLLNHFPGEKRQFYMAGKGGDQRFALDFFPDVIINEVSDPDSHRYALKRCAAFCQQQGKPLVNSPIAILGTGRETIAQKMQGIEGLMVPTTLRIQPRSPQDIIDVVASSSLEYPVILRGAGDHGGESTVRIDNQGLVIEATYPYALDGRDYYITQFVDYQSEDGAYRKYRLAVVGDQVFLRHLIIGDNWLVHINARGGEKHNAAEEEQALNTFVANMGQKLKLAIKEISARLGLDYYGIDCHINNDGDMLAFEINANMNILINTQPSPNCWDKVVQDIGMALNKLISQRAAQSLPS